MTGLSPEMIDAMVAAGLTAEQMAALVKAQLTAQAAADEVRRASKREGAAERQRRKRARERGNETHVTHVTRDMALQDVTARDGTPSEVPPKDNNSNPPPTSPGSDADASAPAVAVAGDDREWLFDDGLKQLIAWGKPERAGRSLIGKWLKTTKDNSELVRRAIEAAAERRVVVPVEWIEQGLKARMERSNGQHGTRNGQTNSAAQPRSTRSRLASIMGYDTEPEVHGSEEERRLSDRDAWPQGRHPTGFLDAEPDATGVYRA